MDYSKNPIFSTNIEKSVKIVIKKVNKLINVLYFFNLIYKCFKTYFFLYNVIVLLVFFSFFLIVF